MHDRPFRLSQMRRERGSGEQACAVIALDIYGALTEALAGELKRLGRVLMPRHLLEAFVMKLSKEDWIRGRGHQRTLPLLKSRRVPGSRP